MEIFILGSKHRRNGLALSVEKEHMIEVGLGSSEDVVLISQQGNVMEQIPRGLLHLDEFAAETINLSYLLRIADRDHVRSEAHQFAIFSMKRYMNVMRSIAQHPG